MSNDSVIERLGVDDTGTPVLPELPSIAEDDLTAPLPSDGPAAPPRAD